MRKEYKTGFSLPAYLSLGWILIMITAFLYFILKSDLPYDLLWDQHKFYFVIFIMIGIIAAYGVTLVIWKHVILDTNKGILAIQNVYEKILGIDRVLTLKEIERIVKKYDIWSRTYILIIMLENQHSVKLNTTFLKDGCELEEWLLNRYGAI